MTRPRLGIVTAVLTAALGVTGAMASDRAPACGAFDVVSTPDSGEGTDLRSLDALDGSNVWVVGHRWDPAGTREGSPLAMRWDGSTFVVEPIPDLSHLGTNPSLESVALAPNGAPWAVGGMRDAVTGANVPLLLRWSAGFWETHSITPVNSFAPRYPRLHDVAAVTADDAWTIGEAATVVNGVVEPFSAHWDGTSWSEVAMPGSADSRTLTAVAATSGAVWAVGYDTVALGARNTTFARVFQFKGGLWSAIDTPAATKTGSVLLDVAVLAANDVWAVGSVGTEGLFLHFDGHTWSTVSAPANADPRSVSGVAADDVWAAGSKGYYHFDGKKWSFLSAPSDPGTGARRAVSAAGPCDVWTVSATNLGASTKSKVERISTTTPPQPPLAPVGLTATPKVEKQIVLQWLPGNNDPTGSVGQKAFVIERCIGTAAGCLTRFQAIAEVGGKTTEYVDDGLSAATSYAYRIYAVNDFGTSEATSPVAAITLPDSSSPESVPAIGTTRVAGGSETGPDTAPVPPYGPPAAPTDLKVKPDFRQIGLTWVAGIDPGPAGRTTFVVERCIGTAPACVTRYTVIRKLPGDVTVFIDSGLQPSTTYSYRLYAVNEAGLSPVTSPATTTTLADPSSPLPDTVPGTVASDPLVVGVRVDAPLPGAPTQLPAMPVDFVAKPVSAKQVNLSWQSGGDPTAPVNQDYFVIERCISQNGTCVTRFATIAKVEGTVTSLADWNVQPKTSYTYRIYALNAAGQSSTTAPETAVTPSADTPSPLPVPVPVPVGQTGSRS